MLDDITKEGFISNYFIKKCIYGRTDFELCGPAVSTFTNVRQGYSYDFLYALPVNGWPDEASEWITRDRPAGWPSQDMITRAVKGKYKHY